MKGLHVGLVLLIAPLCTGGTVAVAAPAHMPTTSSFTAQPGATHSCTKAERARRARRLATYKRQMKAARRAYFKKHHSKRARAKFLRGQNAHLKALQRALDNCRRSPPPPPPPPPPTHQADLVVAMTAVPTIVANDTETETITVANQGPADASGVTLTVSGLSTLLAVDLWTNPVGSCSTSAGVLSCQLGSLAEAATATVTVVVRANLVGVATEAATATGATDDPNQANNTASATLTVVPPTPSVQAQATFVVGSGVTAAQQAFVKYSLDLGATYFHTSLGRDLAPFTVYAEANYDELIQTYAQVEGVTSDQARTFWATTGGGVTGTASQHRLWIFLGSESWAWNPNSGRAKILVHEMFHLLQQQLAGACSYCGPPDQVPPQGPDWLAEGGAEYIGYRAVSANGLIAMNAVRANWISSTKQSAAALSTMETWNGLFAALNAYNLSALAVDHLIGAISPQKLADYYGAIGQGLLWQSAFSTVFGKTINDYYTDFASYRNGL